jgi:hypothetical protein
LSNDCFIISALAYRSGYSSPQLSDIPISPPPSYEAVMKEVRKWRIAVGKINYKLMENFLFFAAAHILFATLESITGIG